MANLSPIIQLILGFALGGLVGFGAYRIGALDRSGGWVAALAGGLVFGLGGIPWAILLLTFFISSSLLSRLFDRQKIALSEKFSKGSRRDYAQVLANGGLGMLLVGLHALLPDQVWPFIAYAGAMATVNADTWATEIGVLSPQPARLITNAEIVERGTSGGVTLLGYLASAAGAAVIGIEAGFLTGENVWQVMSLVIFSGVAGATLDSLMGATIQAIYFCPVCGKETEHHPVHRCGNRTSNLRGWDWLDNDWVNFISSGAGALTSAVLWGLFF